MNNIKTLTLNKTSVVATAQFVALLSIAIALPSFVHIQAITGPVINAILFLSVFFLDAPTAILIGLIPSVAALSFGLLPVALAPMIPFIMVSNALLIIVFSWLHKKSFFTAVVVASTLKFTFLFATSFIVVKLIANKPIAQKSATLMNWPQLITALVGGLVAFLLIKTIKFNKLTNK